MLSISQAKSLEIKKSFQGANKMLKVMTWGCSHVGVMKKRFNPLLLPFFSSRSQKKYIFTCGYTHYAVESIFIHPF